jgi:type IV secretion system protein VirD4
MVSAILPAMKQTPLIQSFLDDFTKDIPRGLPSRFIKHQTAPQARWQAPAAVLSSGALDYDPDRPGGKILIGAMGPKLIGIDDNRHVLTVAGSRAGKSVTLVSNLLFYRGSVLATDPKGELANITAQRRQALGQKVFVLDPFKHTAERLAPLRKAFNPMAGLDPKGETVIEDAGLIADALVVAAGKDPHWDESARNFIEGLILHVASCQRYEGQRNLITVRRLINQALKTVPGDDDDDLLYALEEEMLENAEAHAADPRTEDLGLAIDGAARDFYEKADRERDSVLSTVRRHTKFLDYKAMKAVLTGHDFDLADMKRDLAGITVYLCLPASRIGLCSRWLRIFINQLLDAMERERTKPAAPVLVCLDEFPVLGHMRQLEDAAGQIASFGVKLWVVLQDWSQGKALYGERWETFAGNAGILQFFGNNDLTTTEYIAKKLGKTRVAVERTGDVSAEQRASGLDGVSESVEQFDLLAPEEISRQFARSDRLKRQLVIWAGYNPMILQRVEYFDRKSPLHPVFVGRYASGDGS